MTQQASLLEISDPRNLLAELPKREIAIVEFGCGERKQSSDCVGVDLLDLPGVDIVGDAFQVLLRLPDASLSEIRSSHFLEHVDDLRGLLGEFTRVLRPGGTIDAVVPHFANPYFYSDPTHVRFFGLYTLSYFAHDQIHKRTVPQYEAPLPLTLIRADLRFKTLTGGKLNKKLLKILTRLVNSTAGTREFHEKNLCYILPCYEIHFILEKDASTGQPSFATED